MENDRPHAAPNPEFSAFERLFGTPAERRVLIRNLLIYFAIVLFGTTIVYVTFIESTLSAISDQFLEAGPLANLSDVLIRQLRSALRGSGLLGLLASNVGTVTSALLTMLTIAALTHLIVRLLFGGKGALREQINALLGLYNRFLPFQYVLLALAAFFAWSALPQSLCLFGPAIVVALYVGARVPFKIGEVYAVNTRRGCLGYVGALVVFSLLTGGLFAFLLNALIFAIDVRTSG
ncbi:MAG: hypothetical protein SNJ59_11590 [Aggregatilineales bacterium]